MGKWTDWFFGPSQPTSETSSDGFYNPENDLPKTEGAYPANLLDTQSPASGAHYPYGVDYYYQHANPPFGVDYVPGANNNDWDAGSGWD